MLRTMPLNHMHGLKYKTEGAVAIFVLKPTQDGKRLHPCICELPDLLNNTGKRFSVNLSLLTGLEGESLAYY